MGVTAAGVDGAADAGFDRVIERRGTDSNERHKFGSDEPAKRRFP